MNKKYNRDITKSPKFLEYVNREFEKTAIYATIEELSEFAFGSIENAIKSYINKTGFQNNETI